MSMKVESAERELRGLDRAFRAGELVLPHFERVIERVGLASSEVMVIDWTPDGGGSVFGRLLTAEEAVWRFDLDPDDPDASTLEDVTEAFREKIRTKLRHKPWAVEIVGLRLMPELIPELRDKSHETT